MNFNEYPKPVESKQCFHGATELHPVLAKFLTQIQDLYYKCTNNRKVLFKAQGLENGKEKRVIGVGNPMN